MECINSSRLLKDVNQNALNYDDVILAHGSVYGVYMRRSCSETWLQDDNSDTARKECETPDLSAAVSNALFVTPVSTPDVTYRMFIELSAIIKMSVISHIGKSDFIVMMVLWEVIHLMGTSLWTTHCKTVALLCFNNQQLLASCLTHFGHAFMKFYW